MHMKQLDSLGPDQAVEADDSLSGKLNFEKQQLEPDINNTDRCSLPRFIEGMNT